MDEKTSRNGNSNNLIGGGVLVLIGAVFLVQNLTDLDLVNWNWWALFILIPALGSLVRVWQTYQTEGQLTAATRGPLIGGLVMLLITAIFLFNLNWGAMWPVFLIIAGISILVVR